MNTAPKEQARKLEPIANAASRLNSSLMQGVSKQSERVVVLEQIMARATRAQARFFIVSGRIPGSDEDTTLVLPAESSEEAIKTFGAQLWEDRSVSPGDQKQLREQCRSRYGDDLYITSVHWSATHIHEV